MLVFNIHTTTRRMKRAEEISKRLETVCTETVAKYHRENDGEKQKLQTNFSSQKILCFDSSLPNYTSDHSLEMHSPRYSGFSLSCYTQCDCIVVVVVVLFSRESTCASGGGHAASKGRRRERES